MLFERNNGRVVIYEGGTTQDFILHEWIGDIEAKIGEYLWIGEDSVLGDVIVAFTRRTQEDEYHHIDFYKLIPMENGNLKVFELAKDLVQAKLRDVIVGETIVEQASLKFGSFMWQTYLDDGKIEVFQVRFCGSREYYSEGTCLPCSS